MEPTETKHHTASTWDGTPAGPPLPGEISGDNRPAITVEDGGAPQKRRLTGADVRKARDLKTEDVFVEEWDGFITLKALSAKERDAFESSFMVQKGKKREFVNANIRAKLVVKCAIDEMQNRLWSDDDAGWLGDKNASAVNRLYEAAARLSGITEADADELEKTSSGDPGDASA